jgi:hypothetical protein
MQAGDAACKLMRRIKERRVAIGNLRTPLEEALRNVLLAASCGVTLLQQFRRTSRPDSPVTQQAAYDAVRFRSLSDSKNVRRDKIHHNVVIVAGVESDVASRLRHGPNNIEGLVAIERSNFDGDHVLDFREFPPKTVGQHAATDGWLQVKSDDR